MPVVAKCNFFCWSRNWLSWNRVFISVFTKTQHWTLSLVSSLYITPTIYVLLFQMFLSLLIFQPNAYSSVTQLMNLNFQYFDLSLWLILMSLFELLMTERIRMTHTAILYRSLAAQSRLIAWYLKVWGCPSVISLILCFQKMSMFS
jgi:hypothetical protein